MPSTFRVRPADQSDGVFLGDMVVEAANWQGGAALPKHQVLTAAEHSRYVSGWKRPTDAGFVAADESGESIGAAWYRLFPRNDPGFGYVGTRVPELIIGVRPIWRAHGVGRALLQSLTEHASTEGFARLSLSIQRGNFAMALYRSEGFAVTQSGMDRDTMVKLLR